MIAPTEIARPAPAALAPATGLPPERRWNPLLGFAVVNAAGLGLALEATWLGWVERLLAGDGTGTSHVILATFAAGLGLATREAVVLAREHDALAAGTRGGPSAVGRHLARLAADPTARGPLESAFKLELASRIGHVRTIAGSLVLLGLIGTVLGFMLALAAVEPATAADVDRIGRMVAGLVQGMGVALHTTLLGAVLNIWLMADHRLLEAAAVRLLAGLLRRGGDHASARAL